VRRFRPEHVDVLQTKNDRRKMPTMPCKPP
jgi:hypothetical protein